MIPLVLLAGCHAGEKDPSAKKTAAAPRAQILYVDKHLKGDQFAIRMGDRLRQRLHGHTVQVVDRHLTAVQARRLEADRKGAGHASPAPRPTASTSH